MRIGTEDTDSMSAEQRAVYDEIMSGPRGTVPLVFSVLLDAPELTQLLQTIGRYIRYESSLPGDVREIAILTVAATFGSGYEWSQHYPIARGLGVSLSDCEAARTGDVPKLSAAYTDVARFCLALTRRESLDPTCIESLTHTLGRRGVTELTVIAGYYPMLANGLKVADVDLPVPETLT